MERQQLDSTGNHSPLDGLTWPELSVARQYPKARFRTRVRAFLVDLLVGMLPLVVALIYITGGLIARSKLLTIFVAGGTLEWAVYYFFTKDGHWRGRSIGKGMYGLMVVNVATNRPCSKRESIVRQVDFVFLQLIPFFGFLVEPVIALASRDGRRLGDRAADTQVIAEKDYRPTESASYCDW